MKMKKLFGGLILAATLMTSSCEAILEQMTTTPAFVIPEVMYNGQTFQVTRLATCKYGFTTDSKYLTIEERKDGKFIATVSGAWVSETSNKSVPVKVTAVNLDDSTIEPQVMETVLLNWSLKLYEGNAVVTHTELKAGTTYRLEMVAANTGTKIETILGGLTDKTNPQALEWSFAADKLKEMSRTATTLEFRPLTAGAFEIVASLGEYKVNMSGVAH